MTDPCIRSSDPSFGPDFSNCNCTQDYNGDYFNWLTIWYEPEFDDSEWVQATTFTEAEAVPGLGASPFSGCRTGNYCDRDTYPEESWGNSEFIWTSDAELDNVIVCRYKYGMFVHIFCLG